MKRILITGISGFVGTGLSEYFSGNEESEIFGYSRNNKTAKNSLSKYSVNFIEHLTAAELDKNNIDIVIHLAGIAHDLSGKFNEEDYFKANVELTRKIYNEFAASKAGSFVFVSSVKAVVDQTDDIITEDFIPNPHSPYGKSKRLAEEYILGNQIKGKQSFILRPCMIHGPGNKGNLNLLYKFVRSGMPYPLADFENKRSFLSLSNFCFVIGKIISGKLKAGMYMLSDSTPVSTNKLIDIISEELNKKVVKLHIPKIFIIALAKMGSLIHLPFNFRVLNKLCGNMVVSNEKLIMNLKEELPVSSTDGLKKTIRSFNE